MQPYTPPPGLGQHLIQNAVGLGTMAATNAGMTAISGGPEASGIAAVLNVLAQHLKHYAWFDESRWLHPTMMAIAFPIAFFGFFHDGTRALLTAGQATLTAVANYHSAQSTVLGGAMRPVAPENEYANRGQPSSAVASPSSPSSAGAGPVSPPPAPAPDGTMP